jgi:hypothetical protein
MLDDMIPRDPPKNIRRRNFQTKCQLLIRYEQPQIIVREHLSSEPSCETRNEIKLMPEQNREPINLEGGIQDDLREVSAS